jgi:hypothetical protein
MDQSNVCRDIQKIEGLIRSCLPITQKLYKVTNRLKTKEEVEEYFPGFLAFTDCTEQPIPRPAKNRKKRKYTALERKRKYTALERKRNTRSVKNLYTANQKGLLIYKTKRKQRGRRHDYKVYKKNHPKLPKDVLSMYDLEFLGVEKDFPEQRSSLPIKKEKDHELTEVQKEYNRNHSAKRIVIEHAICRIKKCRIMNDVFRNRLRKYNRVSDIVSGLVNYRILNSC